MKNDTDESVGSSVISQNTKPKNVLILMTDQQNAKTLSLMSHPHIRTPNIDRLAKEGVTFENACCATPVCTASRGAFHTGRWPHVKGPNLNTGSPDPDPKVGLQPEDVLMATCFCEKHYKTRHHGKWHLGDITRHSAWNWDPALENYWPAYHQAREKWLQKNPVNIPPGDAEFYGYPFYMIDACKHAHKNCGELLKATPQSTAFHIGRIGLPLEIDKTVWITDNFLKDLDKYKDEPFMMVWSVDPPHAEWAVQDPYYSAVDLSKVEVPTNMPRPDYFNDTFACGAFDLLGEEGVREYLRCYYGQVMMVDDQVGRIIDKLEETGRLDDTLIVFTSDHGDMNAAHRAIGKGLEAFYDEILKVPLIMRWPRDIKTGRRVKTIVNNIDVMPTVLDYAGLEIPSQCQGQSLRQFIDGKEDMDRAGFCERTHPELWFVQRMIRTQKWKLSFCYSSEPDKTGLLEERWPLELYDLIDDPLEENNISSDPTFNKVRTRLLKRLLEWMEETNDPGLKRLPKLC